MKPPFRRGQHLSSLDLLSCALQIIPYIKYFCIIVTAKYFFFQDEQVAANAD